MGFTLQFALDHQLLEKPDLGLLREFIARNGVNISEAFDYDEYEKDPFYEVWRPSDDCEDDGGVGHLEVGWSWWFQVQLLAEDHLGLESCPHIRGVHAWHGVAVPFLCDPTLLGEPAPYPVPQLKKPSLLERFSLKPPTVERQYFMDQMAYQFSGGMANLHVVSAPALLAELDQLAEALGLEEVDLVKENEDVDEDNPVALAELMTRFARKFLRAGIAGNHLVWFIK